MYVHLTSVSPPCVGDTDEVVTLLRKASQLKGMQEMTFMVSDNNYVNHILTIGIELVCTNYVI